MIYGKNTELPAIFFMGGCRDDVTGEQHKMGLLQVGETACGCKDSEALRRRE